MAKYQQYAEYKDSGVEWLGEIPKDWVASKFAYVKTVLTDFTANGSFADLKKNVIYRDEPSYARLVRLTDLRINLDDRSGVWIDEKAYNYLGKSALFGGEFLLANVGAHAGLFYQMPENKGNASLAPNMFMAKFDSNKVLREFIAYVAQGQSVNEQLRLNATASSAQPKLNKDDFKSVRFTYPSIEEQAQIANFLDYETAQIDTLIDKQQTLIQLLKEKRQAVISHAVTKGLNPDAPMKDSGVEWLGEVPEHWTVCALKHILATPITDGPHETPIFLDEGVPFISAEAVSQGYINFDKKRAHISKLDNEKYSKKYTPKKYDIYIVKSGATTGISAIVETDREFNIWSPLAVIRCAPYCEPYFTLFAIRSKYFQEEIRLNWNYGTQQNIGMAVLGNLLITYPPRKEAQEISNYLKRVTEKMNELIERAEKAIQLMQERRTALISAAVTGKIDVRGWRAPDSK